MTTPSFERLVWQYEKRIKALLLRYPDLFLDPSLAWGTMFHDAAYNIARRMVEEAAHENMKSWRAAAMKSTRAAKLYRMLQEEIKRTGIGPILDRAASVNANLISSLPGDIARHITERASTLQKQGKRAPEIEKELRSLAPRLTKSRIELIARTEIGKAETDLTRARAEEIGLDWYQWLTSQDVRVRPSHRNMNDVLVAWSDPPQPEELIRERSTLGHYHAGCCPRCRCIAAPVADLNEISWPARVYTGGTITRMARLRFAKLAGIKIAA
jgi:SPP1 gp7 family putative phage head morphogenesis protein